jgi:hypothetical protein
VFIEVAGLIVVAVLALHAARPASEAADDPKMPLLRGSSGQNGRGDHYIPEVVAKET